jgi:hypothetical protein
MDAGIEQLARSLTGGSVTGRSGQPWQTTENASPKHCATGEQSGMEEAKQSFVTAAALDRQGVRSQPLEWRTVGDSEVASLPVSCGTTRLLVPWVRQGATGRLHIDQRCYREYEAAQRRS